MRPRRRRPPRSVVLLFESLRVHSVTLTVRADGGWVLSMRERQGGPARQGLAGQMSPGLFEVEDREEAEAFREVSESCVEAAARFLQDVLFDVGKDGG